MTVQYELKTPIEYAFKGDMQAASFIELSEPTYQDMTNFMLGKQAFVKGVAQAAESSASEASGDDMDITGDDVIGFLYTSGIDMAKIFVAVQELVKSSGLVDGEVKVTTPLMNKLSVKDAEGLMGFYIANFIAPYLTDGA